MNPDWKGAKNCKFETKEDNSVVNAQAQIEEKFNELKAAKISRLEGNSSKTAGRANMGNGEIVPNVEEFPDWDNVILDEVSCNRNISWEYALEKLGDMKFDRSRKEIIFDLNKSKHKAPKQTAESKNKMIRLKNLWKYY